MVYALSRALAVVLSAVLLLGCAPAAAKPKPESGAAVGWQVTPLASFYTPAPATPTLTPVPVPPTLTPSATPKPNEALALLRQADGRKPEVKSSRALLEMFVEGQDKGQPVSFTVTVELETADPNARMKMALVGIDTPMAFDMDFITVGDTAYWRTGDEWTAFPGGKSELKSETKLLDAKDMEELIARATDAKIVGRRTVKGVECDVISLALSYQDLRDLAALGGGNLGSQPSQDVRFEVFNTEVAIGVADKVVHQMVMTMSGAATNKPAERFSLALTMTVWDINSPDIVIKAPANVKPFSTPTPTRTASPRSPTSTPVPSELPQT